MGKKSLAKHWLEIIKFTNYTDRNRELLLKYLANDFATEPHQFYQLTMLIKDELLKSNDISAKIDLAEKFLTTISPLCEKFNFYSEKSLLNDIAFSIIEPEIYQKINQILKSYQSSSELTLQKISNQLVKLLKKHGFNCQIKGRYKSIYSIYKKLLKKNADLIDSLKLKDIFAFRIIVNNNSVKDCFSILTLLHDHYFPIPKHFKDFITIPKINGYQSLHTGLSQVLPGLDLPIEIQIRTKSMHEFAEKGLAAHWVYEKTKKTRLFSDAEKRLHEQLQRKNTHQQKIFCFSHKGDIFELEKGATPFDFATKIHSDLGHKYNGAIVNSKPVKDNYKLNSADRIHILTT